MVSKHAVIGIALLLHIVLIAPGAVAQPTLPDITGVAGKGVVSLSWNCQYSNVEAISVLRAIDSFADFTLIGYVENVAKGAQAFTDPHPLPGKNCYKVAVGFKSGLTWRSNRYCIYVEKYALESDKPLIQIPNSNTQIPNSKRQTTNHTPQDILSSNPIDANPKPVLPKIRLPKVINDTIENPITFIKSRFINLDEKTGHVHMFLPEDVSEHHYSVKFFDSKNQVVFEAPWIDIDKIIIDKRNFPGKGIYKFILRKDYIELEEGYIEVKTPNP